jgi:hypothetical protein
MRTVLARWKLHSTSCHDSFCLAVGVTTTGGKQTTLAESWDGNAWQIVPTAPVTVTTPNRTITMASAARAGVERPAATGPTA